ncbi:hypothetical protein FDH34_gp451 [Serratia phage BF]|uniref:Uncharacterized protein n=1 Tax=Serratia phage BF TaxID=1962671 RepID=A0A1S6UBD0_9CAUD|nr:hypothetical protein FDH34_gp451 [Serratia phage BF]AQW88994.1 hypothetical protein BF_0469 [Serratia phage BF]QXO11614.1 hypothetical protein pEaSNUABM19_00495 [Erwinia phage pEa_SNUABM_19]QXO12162.1 hypothetical protein pEaSNUABM44_00493 [Erwinia phage pEa_SNUABM_44]QXO12718.1 hypothetical protein pEaSNUABM49_00497 [Erwinia phage pEa_SNUABM_49]
MSVEKILSKMRQNKRDWSMPKLLTVASKLNIPYSNHRSSHYIFKYEGITDNLSIPENKKDIHPDYITKFLRFVDRVLELQSNNGSVAQ